MNQASNKIVKFTGKPPRAGAGRPRGSLNKLPGAVKDMILEALNKSGGVEYLRRQADENPVAFMALLGKIMPMQVTSQLTSSQIEVTWIELVAPGVGNGEVNERADP